MTERIDDDQAAIMQHNRRVQLADAAGKLDAAADVLEVAQGDLSDVPLHMEQDADRLQPCVTLMRELATELRRRMMKNRQEGTST